MSKPIIDVSNSCTQCVIWQEGDDDMPIGEPAIVLKQYENSNGMVEIKQGHNEVLVNASTLRALAKQLIVLARKAKEMTE
jgi:hypothetical protein